MQHEGGVRKLAAIVFTDMKSFSKKMAEDEVAAFDLLQKHDALLRMVAAKHNGKVIKSIGDSLMIDFSSAVDALNASVEAQIAFWSANQGKNEFGKMEVRIGIHLGDVMATDNDMFGDGVNIASRVESITEPTRICITSDLYSQVKNKTELGFYPLGEISLKNIPYPVEIYEVLIPSVPELAQPSKTAVEAQTRKREKDSEARKSKMESEQEAARWQERLQRQKVDEEKEKKVRQHYERAGELLRDGQFDLAEKEVGKIFELYAIHAGAQQLQMQIEEERYKKKELERQKKASEKRALDEERERKLRALESDAERAYNAADLDEVLRAMEAIRSLAPQHRSLVDIEVRLKALEDRKEREEREKAENVQKEVSNPPMQAERRQKPATLIERRSRRRIQSQTRQPKNRLYVIAATILFFIAVVIFGFQRITSFLFAKTITVAVLPFNTDHDSLDQRVFGTFAQHLLAKTFSNADNITTITPFRTESNDKDFAGIAGALQVRYLIRGSLTRSVKGFTSKITIYDSDEGTEIFSKETDSGLFELPSAVARVGNEILSALEIDDTVASAIHQPISPSGFELYCYGRYFLSADSLLKAQQYFLESARIDFLYPPTMVGLADLRIDQYKLKPDSQLLGEAAELCREALRLDSHESSARVSLAEVFYLEQDFRSVIANLQAAAQSERRSPRCLRLLCRLALATQAYDEALEFGNQAVLTNPDDKESQIVLGICHALRKEYQASTECFTKAVALGESDSLVSARYLLSAWSGSNRYSDVVQYCQKRLGWNKEDYRACYWMSRAYQMMPDLKSFGQCSEKGIALLRDHLEKDPQDAVAQSYLGLFLARQGKKDLGESEMSKTGVTQTWSSELAFRRAGFYAITNKPDRAVKLLSEALARDYDFSEIIDPDLDLLREDSAFVAATKRVVDLDALQK